MSLLEAVILGLIQGLSEFLPVSSSGHLVIAQELLGVRMPGLMLEVLLHFATLLSVVVVYRSRLWALLRGAMVRDPDELRYIGLLLVASIPAAIAGLGLERSIETAFDTPAVTGYMLLATGAILYSTRFLGWIPPAPNPATAVTPPAELPAAEERLPPRHHLPTFRDAVTMGLAQTLALLPGISRSGTTITAGLWMRLRGESAAEFSFLMSIIAVGGANLLKLPELGTAASSAGAAALTAGFLASLVAGIVAIKALVWLLRRQEFHRFAYYVWPLGVVYLIYLGVR